jgi:putative SOS response-associated peptidase YedK
MPVILEPDDYGLWLDHKVQHGEELSDLFRPAAENILRIVPVSTYVNKAGRQGPECVAPVSAG